MLSKYSFPKTLKGNYIDFDIIGGIRPNTEYALYITCDPATITNNCWCGFITSDVGWCSDSFYYGDKRCIILKTDKNVTNNSKLRLRGDKGLIIKHARLIELVTNSKYSRIERFLYALYSLDSSDLPTPLSRIEELYKCLVTGEEAPTFEPISRVEKYLMAILGAYDVDELPNPLSRVEVLLYKLATGDDNLDDVKSFLSEHEELLAEIIRNGGVGGNIDIEYVLYTLSTEHNTLYNTAEKPVKSAILKGSTKYRDIDTGEFLETFEEGRNLELVSVRMPVLKTIGKNLFDINSMSNINNWDAVVSNEIPYCSYKINLKPNTTYTFSQKQFVNIENVYASFGLEKGGYEYLLAITHPIAQYPTTIKLTTDDRGLIYVKLYNANTTLETFISKLSNNQLQLEESSTATLYEPFKSNILTVNEDVELRGIYNYGFDNYVNVREVNDKLDLISGKFVRHIGEVTLDGSDDEGYIDNWSEEAYYIGAVNENFERRSVVYSAELPFTGCTKENYPSLMNGGGIGLFLSLPKTYTNGTQSTAELRKWLAKNPVTIQYILETESVKTVDLSVVDQDENDTKLSTFDDITHVILSSEGLIPEAELEVATKNEEVLNTMSFEMDDISTTQNALQETSNTQSENVDATMLATTEIYEGLL